MRLEVARVTVSEARVLVATNSGKSIVDLDWVVALRYQITQPMERDECEVNTQDVKCKARICEMNPEEKQSAEFQQLVWELPKWFTRKGQVKNYEMKVKIKDDVKNTQQKSRRVPIHIKNQVDIEIEKLLKSRHVENVDKIQYDVFIQQQKLSKKINLWNGFGSEGAKSAYS